MATCADGQTWLLLNACGQQIQATPALHLPPGSPLASKAHMTKDELARSLQHLDPGATLPVAEGELAAIFGAGALSSAVVQAIEEFALEHRCTFSYHEPGRARPCFEKDDVF